MSSWLDNFRQARFRNVEFYVSNSEISGGRKIQSQEFPERDDPEHQDFGRRGRKFPIEGYIFGDNYFSVKKDLIEACEKKGNGILIHPYYGSQTVVCRSYRIRETIGETRMCRFSMEFSEDKIAPLTAIEIDTQAAVLSSREAALLALQKVFLAAYSIVRKTYNVIDNVKNTVGVGVQAVSYAKTIHNSIPEFTIKVGNLLSQIDNLVYDPVELLDQTIGLMTFGTLPTDDYPATEANSINQFNKLAELFPFVPDSYTDKEDPAYIFSSLISIGALITAGGLTSVIGYDSIDSADATEKILFDRINTVTSDSDLATELFSALRDLRAKVNLDIQNRGTRLPRFVEITLTQSIPTLVLSHNLYGSIDREGDIINRNAITHPGFTPRGVPVEVLTDVE